MTKILLIASMFVLASCYLSEELPPDQDIWAYGLPSSTGLSDSSLLTLDANLKTANHGFVTGLIVIKNDHLVFENYYNSSSRYRLHPIGRATFTVTILMLHELIADGYIASLDAPIHTYLPSYEAIFADDPRKKAITFRHLLAHRSGLSWNESLVNTQRSDSDFLQMRSTSDWVGYVLSRPLESEPGLRTAINTGSGVILMKIFKNVLGSQDLQTYFEDRLFSALEITNFTWNTTPDNIPDGSTGLNLTAMDYAKIGYLTLQEGRWANKQRVIDREWMLDITSAQVPVGFDYSLGYGWWVFTEDFLSRYLYGIDNIYFISAEGGQNIYVIPDQQMVVCIMAENYYYTSIFNPSLVILLKTLEAAEPTVLN